MGCRVGIAYRPALQSWLRARPSAVDVLEVTAEDFYKNGERLLTRLSDSFPLSVHTETLSLGAPGAPDRVELELLRSVVDLVDPVSVSDHVGFRRLGGDDLGHPVSVAWDAEGLSSLAERVRTAASALGRPFLAENLLSFVQWDPVAEPAFLNRLCEEAGCGLLLDLTALLANSRNHAADPVRWLEALDPGHVKQVHVGGLSRDDDVWIDAHAAPVESELHDLLRHLLSIGAEVDAILLERDDAFPTAAELERELECLREIATEG